MASKIPKYVLATEGDIYSSVASTLVIYGPMLHRHTSVLSAVCTIHRSTSYAYRLGDRVLGCIESGQWELGELVSIAKTHQNVFRSGLWSPDLPSAMFLRNETGTKSRLVSKVAIGEEGIRYAVESLKNEVNKTFTVPSLSYAARPSDMGLLADLEGYVCTELNTISIPLLACGFANVASKKKQKSELIGYDYIDGRLFLYRRGRLMTEEEVKADQARQVLPPQESAAMQEARRMGRYMQTTNYLGNGPKSE